MKMMTPVSRGSRDEYHRLTDDDKSLKGCSRAYAPGMMITVLRGASVLMIRVAQAA